MTGKIVVFCFACWCSVSIFARKTDPNFIIHKVVAGESLYRIAQKSSVTVDVILKNNPGITAANLKPGMILRIPSTYTPVKPETKSTSSNSIQLKHVVAANETLYSISKKYGVTVDAVMKWNNLKDATLKTGMTLTIYTGASVSTGKVTPPKQASETMSTSNQPQKSINPESSQPTEEMPSDLPAEDLSLSSLVKQYTSQQKTGVGQTEKGTADLMASTSQDANTYFAMHKTAPVGTILKIRNLENNKITYAKVIGRLPDLEENKFVRVRVSMGVAKALQMGFGKVYVEMDYAQ